MRGTDISWYYDLQCKYASFQSASFFILLILFLFILQSVIIISAIFYYMYCGLFQQCRHVIIIYFNFVIFKCFCQCVVHINEILRAWFVEDLVIIVDWVCRGIWRIDLKR